MINDTHQRLQLAIGARVGSTTDLHDELDLAHRWFTYSRKHIVFYSESNEARYTESATLAWSLAIPSGYLHIYDPVVFIKEHHCIDASMSDLVYLYDIHLLSAMGGADTLKFFSYLKHSLILGIRVLITIPCDTSRGSLDTFMSNKLLSDKLHSIFNDDKYFSKVGL